MRIAMSVVLGVLWLGSFSSAQPVEKPPVGATHLQVEYLDAPAIDTPSPRFGWWMTHRERDAMQSAYHVQVASSEESLTQGTPELWDSGETASGKNVHVEYAGAPLQSLTTYFWRVRISDQQGRWSDWSDTARFETGFLNPAERSATWISAEGIEPAPLRNGYHSKLVDTADAVQWVEIDLSEPRPIAAVLLYPARPGNLDRDAPGFGFPRRFTIAAGEQDAQTIVADFSAEEQRNPGLQPRYVPIEGGLIARYVRVRATQLADNGAEKYLFALAELDVRGPNGEAWAVGAKAKASSTLEELGWGLEQLTDGEHYSVLAQAPAPMFRKEFEVVQPVVRARAYASGLGYYALYLNGQRVGDRVLDPAYTDHQTRTLYSVYDVTELVREGANAVGMMIGQGWWKGAPAAWLELHLSHSDGSETVITTDDTWRWTTGPIRAQSLYHGETYDARAEVPGWADSGFDSAAWNAVAALETPPANMNVQTMPPIRVVEEREVTSIQRYDDGRFIIDFGQNLTGWVKFTVEGEAGQQITLRHAEVLDEQGKLNPLNLRSARATDRYILRGGGPETYAPHFTHHGFRYVEVSGWPKARLPHTAITAQVVHTDLPKAGGFITTEPLLQGIANNMRWTLRGNQMSVPTDCPQRDERMGWMADAHLSAEPLILQFNACAYYENWLRVIADSQGENGEIPDTAPRAHFGAVDGSPPWAIAYPLLVHYLYRYYENERVVATHYDNIVRWFATLEGHANAEGVVEHCTYGDWIGMEETPCPLIATAVYYWTAQLLEEFAAILDQGDDAQGWAEKKAKIAQDFNRAFWNSEQKFYGNGSQTSQILPLMLGLAGENTVAARARLINEVETARAGHLATGILGTKYLFDQLAFGGRSDLAFTVLLQEDYPSWGFMLANGATTIWELWKNETGPGMNSHNHPALGSVYAWLAESVAGLRRPAAPGYAEMELAPVMDPRVASAQVFSDTVRGRASISWGQEGYRHSVQVQIPPNSRARVHVPTLGKRLSPTEANVVPSEEYSDHLVYELGSGTYAFFFSD